MITIACVNCHLALRTTGKFDEMDYLVGIKSDWYPDRYPCPRSGCNCRMTLTDVMESEVLELLEVHDLSPQECFQAFNGLGLPEERSCTPADLQTAMQGCKIESIDVHPISNDRRSVIHSILMENGTRIYFGSSPQGAMIYRIAPPRSFTKELLNGQ